MKRMLSSNRDSYMFKILPLVQEFGALVGFQSFNPVKFIIFIISYHFKLFAFVMTSYNRIWYFKGQNIIHLTMQGLEDRCRSRRFSNYFGKD